MAVGTTSLRALEGAAAADGRLQAGSGGNHLLPHLLHWFTTYSRRLQASHHPLLS